MMIQTQQFKPSWWQRIRAIDFNAPTVVRRFLVAVPLLFGVWSILLGQDANYDLYNYHLYNAFAFLNDKLGIDFAPAGSQSYFNPSLDLAYYLLNMYSWPWFAGFVMGVVHGLNFLLVYGVARKALAYLPAKDRLRIPLFLALTGSLTANFLSELGSSMGDNTTALFSLATLWLILTCWERLQHFGWKTLLIMCAAGLIAGVGIGLKLTNAVYALALCIALLWYPARFMQRAVLVTCFGLAVLLGLALSGGYWFLEMWQTFQNPLFPQFSAIFPNPLTSNITITDLRWRPRNVVETLLWPFIISLDSGRVAAMDGTRQYIWAVAYLLLIIAAGKWCYARLRPVALPRVDARSRYVLVYVVVGFVAWMELFSIYRYIVSIELLAPLVVYILFATVLPQASGCKWSVRVIAVCSLLVVFCGISTWGHEGWAKHPFHAELPELSDPTRTMVILPGGDPPLAVLAVSFPKEVAFAQLYAYPPGPQFPVRMEQMTQQRSSGLYGVFAGRYDSRVNSIEKIDSRITRFGLSASQSGCDILHWLVSKLHLRMEVATSQEPGKLCRLQARHSDLIDVVAENQAVRDKKRSLFDENRLKLIDDSCRNYRFGIGSGVQIYQLCQLERAELPR